MKKNDATDPRTSGKHQESGSHALSEIHSAFPESGRERLLRLPEVKMRTGLSRSSIYSKVASGTFPAQKKLGAKMVGWYQSQIDAWIANPR